MPQEWRGPGDTVVLDLDAAGPAGGGDVVGRHLLISTTSAQIPTPFPRRAPIAPPPRGSHTPTAPARVGPDPQAGDTAGGHRPSPRPPGEQAKADEHGP